MQSVKSSRSTTPEIHSNEEKRKENSFNGFSSLLMQARFFECFMGMKRLFAWNGKVVLAAVYRIPLHGKRSLCCWWHSLIILSLL